MQLHNKSYPQSILLQHVINHMWSEFNSCKCILSPRLVILIIVTLRFIFWNAFGNKIVKITFLPLRCESNIMRLSVSYNGVSVPIDDTLVMENAHRRGGVSMTCSWTTKRQRLICEREIIEYTRVNKVLHWIRMRRECLIENSWAQTYRLEPFGSSDVSKCYINNSIAGSKY